jgi:hypothetical protein
LAPCTTSFQGSPPIEPDSSNAIITTPVSV